MPRTCAAVQPNSKMVEVRQLELEGLLELRPRRWFDERGFFSEVWRDEWLVPAGLDVRFVQDNHSYSKSRGVLRGLHFQRAPAAQHKLVRVSRGSVFDVAVDVRSQSPTFGRWAGVTLSAAEWNQLFVPEGFAHGFVALEDDTEVLYKVSASYSPEQEQSLRFDDPAIGIAWPVEAEALIVSAKDRAAPLLSEIETGF
jgi:dTDP-4-dehydrorhamnose 3,5-epimerase